MSDTEKAQPTFKAGDKALLEVEVMVQEPPSKMTSNKTLYQVKIPYPFSDYHTCFVDAPILHPAPREGEYKLTVAEVKHLCIQAILFAVFEIRTPKQWMEWVKERLDDPHYFDFYGLSAEEKGGASEA